MSEHHIIEDDRPFQENARRRLLLAMGAVAILLIVTLFFLQRDRNRPLLPERPVPTRDDDIVNSQPVLVTFDRLNDDPYAFLGKRIRVTGDLARLPSPECIPKKGPALGWSLIAEDLRLDAAGFDRIVRLLPEGASLTVEGIWTLYEGPVGCGKEPAAAQLWYLQVSQIRQPNPIVVGIRPGIGTGQAASIQVDPTATADLETTTISVTPSDTVSPTISPTSTPTPPGTITSSPEETATIVVTSITTPSPSSTPPGQPQLTATATVTPTPRPSATATPSRSVATATPTPTTRPVLITSTPGPTATATTEGYPAPTATATASGYPPSTETPDPYD